MFFICISPLFFNKLLKNSNENRSKNNRTKHLMLSDSKPGSLCLIPCYTINGKPMCFYNEWKKIHKGLVLATELYFSSGANNWTLLWKSPFIMVHFVWNACRAAIWCYGKLRKDFASPTLFMGCNNKCDVYRVVANSQSIAIWHS